MDLDPRQNMRLMYHNFGIVRSDKELIRHRMFMTKLKPGCEEEYKSRHDALIAQRGDSIDPGPDSNFSIWSAADTFLAMMKLIRRWKQKKHRKNANILLHGKHVN